MALYAKGAALNSLESTDRSSAEQCFLEAIDVARSQSAKSWELHAATRDLLAPVYGWFIKASTPPI